LHPGRHVPAIVFPPPDSMDAMEIEVAWIHALYTVPKDEVGRIYVVTAVLDLPDMPWVTFADIAQVPTVQACQPVPTCRYTVHNWYARLPQVYQGSCREWLFDDAPPHRAHAATQFWQKMSVREVDISAAKLAAVKCASMAWLEVLSAHMEVNNDWKDTKGALESVVVHLMMLMPALYVAVHGTGSVRDYAQNMASRIFNTLGARG